MLCTSCSALHGVNANKKSFLIHIFCIFQLKCSLQFIYDTYQLTKFQYFFKYFTFPFWDIQQFVFEILLRYMMQWHHKRLGFIFNQLHLYIIHQWLSWAIRGEEKSIQMWVFSKWKEHFFVTSKTFIVIF